MDTQPTGEQLIDLSGRELGPYRLVIRIGYGGTATVYRAVDRETGVEVAVKVLHRGSDRTTIQRFQKEIGLARSLCEKYTNRHLARIVKDGLDDGLHWVAMELMRGKTVREVLLAAPRSGLRWEAAAFIVLNVCTAVASMHDLEVVHRDIKPENIFLSRTPTGELWVTLLDLGIAKEFSAEPKTQEGLHLTAKGEHPGTWPYMAPERIHGGPCTPASDLYSLGVLFYECLHRRLPFPPSENYTAIKQQVDGSLADLPWKKLPENLKNVVVRAMAKECGARFPSAFEMGRALNACLESAAEWVDGNAAALELLEAPTLDPAPQRDPSLHTASLDEKTTNVPPPKIAASSTASPRPADASSAAPPTVWSPPAAPPIGPIPPTGSVRAPSSDQAETLEGPPRSALLAQHGPLIARFMRVTLTTTMISLMTMVAIAGDPRWTKIQQRWQDTEQEADVLREDRPQPPARSSAEAGAERPGIAAAGRPNPEPAPIPTTPASKPEATPTRSDPARSTPPASPGPLLQTDSTPSNPVPPQNAEDSVLMDIDSTKKTAKPVATTAPPPTLADAPKESAGPLTDEKLRRKVIRYASQRVLELCPVSPTSSSGEGSICVELELSKEGFPLTATLKSATPSGISFIRKEGVECVLRIVKANIDLSRLTKPPQKVDECFTVKR